MPKNEVYKKYINKEIFQAIIAIKKYSIRNLASLQGEEFICSDRTIRRSLDSYKIRPEYLDKFAKFMNVDSRFLSGELYTQKYKVFSISMYLSQIDKYPYNRQALDELRQKEMREHLSSIFSLFNISYEQFDSLDFDTQYNLQHDLFESISTILSKYFKVDGYGNTDMMGLSRIIYDLESYKDDHYTYLYGDIKLRQ